MCAKWFMKDPWESAEYVPKRLRAIIDLIRPFTLLAPIIGAISSISIALISEGSIGVPVFSPHMPFVKWPDLPLYKIIWGTVSLVLLNAASNTLNQVYDRHIDRINKSYRPIPSGLISAREGIWIAIVLYAFALWRAALVNPIFLTLVSLLTLLTIAYSVPPLRLKKRLWISNIAIAVPRGLLGFLSAWTIVGDITSAKPWLMGSVMAVFLIGSTTTKDFTDMKGDRRYGVRTLPVVYGKSRAILLSAPFFVIPFLMLGAYGLSGLLPSTSVPMAGMLLIWSIFTIILVIKEDDKGVFHFENSPAWLQMYLILMGMQSGFILIYLL